MNCDVRKRVGEAEGREPLAHTMTVVMSRETPKQLLQSVVDGINAGDLEALMSLYESEAAFCRVFKKVTGVTPASWRSRRRRV